MRSLKILLCIEELSAITPRSLERLSSLIKVFISDEKLELSILTETALQKEIKFGFSIAPKIQWLTNDNPSSTGSNSEENVLTGMSDTIERLDNEENYHIIVLHGQEIISASVYKKYGQKVLPYIADMALTSIEAIKKAPAVFVESEELKYRVTRIAERSADAIILVPPIIDSPPQKGNYNHRRYSMLYMGQEVNGIIKLFQAVKKKKPTFSMMILSNNLEGKQKSLILRNRDRRLEGLKIKELGQENELNQYIHDSDIGYLFDSSNTDSEEVLEQFLKYAVQGKPVIVKKTPQFAAILGEDYPLFADGFKEMKEKVLLALQNQELYKLAAEKCTEGSLGFQFSVVKKSILNKLWEFNKEKYTILFAGHDFKFLNEYIDFCRKNQVHVLIDKWKSHNVHDIGESRKLLQKADIIFCEWGLGNAVFYSKHKLPGQQLYIRVHRQELETNFLHEVNFNHVTNVIAISPYIFEEFNRLKKIPRDKLILIQNMVDVEKYRQSKKENITYHIGIMGILPKLKRIDRAIQIFEKLWQKDTRYKLFIKGKLPEDLPWLKNRKAEMDYFTEVFDKINNAPWKDHIVFDGHGDNVAEWLTNINFMLSTSDIESFHLAPMEGMASGATPIVFTWPGSDTIYPGEFIVDEVEEAAELILKLSGEDNQREKDYLPIVSKYDKSIIINRLNQLLFK